jgi:TfoX/Sxy family transcriptional regulator of competence genes
MSEATEELAERVRAMIGHKPGVTEKKMFGGYGFMLNGNMVCGAMSTGYLLLRVGSELHAEAVKRPGAQTMHHGGRDMIGFVEVTDEIENDDGLKSWIDFAWSFVKTLPPKAEKPAPAKRTGKPVGKKAAAPAKKAVAPAKKAAPKKAPAKKAAPKKTAAKKVAR